MGNSENQIISTEYDPNVTYNPADANKRFYKRSEIILPILLVTQDANTKKRKLVRFDTVNLSKNGVGVKTNAYPFKPHQAFEMILLYTLKENVIKIYYLDCFSKHVTNGITGFYFQPKWKPQQQ